MDELFNLKTLIKADVTGDHYIAVGDASKNTAQKYALTTLFPSITTAGDGIDIFTSATLTNKNQINFKGLKSGDTGLLTLATTTNNVVFTVLEAGIDLNECNNGTAGFLKVIDFSGTVTGANAVVNGGTGLDTIVKGAVLYTSDADTIAASAAMSTDGQLLIGNSASGVPSLSALTAGANITITNAAGRITIAASLATLAATLDCDNNNIDLGTGWISGNGTDEGINVDSDGKVFMGEGTPTAKFVAAVNIKGSVEFTNDSAPTIKPTATTESNVGMGMTIEAGGSASGAAGHLTLKAGTASGSAAGGDVILVAGRDTSGSADGEAKLQTYTGGTAVTGLTVAAEGQDVTVNVGDLVIAGTGKGIVLSESSTVTQTTSHVTGLTVNSTSGVITLAAVVLDSSTKASFIVTNSTVKTDSVILVTMQDENTTEANQLSCAINTVANGSFVISIVNPHSAGATSATASKIHFLVINKS
jgi:hypothetical protein